MSKIMWMALFALLFCPMAAHAQCPFETGYTCTFYGGDLDLNDPNQNGLANENDAIVPNSVLSPNYGAATYQNFLVSGPITVKGLATNNLSGLNPTTAYWEMRSGVSEGNGGTLIASGTGPTSNQATGRADFGYDEYTNFVGGLNILLNPGTTTTYWFSVVPQDPTNANRSFNSDTDGRNEVGTQIFNQQYFTSSFFGEKFTNANNEGVFQEFSSAVYDDPGGPVPEPSSLILLGSGLIGAGSAFRRRKRGSTRDRTREVSPMDR